MFEMIHDMYERRIRYLEHGTWKGDLAGTWDILLLLPTVGHNTNQEMTTYHALFATDCRSVLLTESEGIYLPIQRERSNRIRRPAHM